MSGLQTAHSSVIGDALTAGTQPFVDQSARLTAVTASPGAGQFLSSVIGRASIPNLAADLRASLGIERVMTQQFTQLTNEFGPSGEPVYSVVGDDRGLIRFVGVTSSHVSTNGSPIRLGTGGYIEIIFFGTGLNLLSYADGYTYTAYATVDGGAESVTNIYPITSNILAARGYGENCIFPVVTTSLGAHTVKIRNNSGADMMVFAFEILNANASGLVNINPGTGYLNGQKYINAAADAVAYKPTGMTLGKGGRVVQYLKEDGTIASVYTEVPSSPLFLSSASHTNEEVVRTYGWREFGAGRADDFSLLAGTQRAAAFTLDDGTTTLVTDGSSALTHNSTDCFTLYGIGYFFTLTFVGTGLDITLSGPTSRPVNMWVDGTPRATAQDLGTSTAIITCKIASGLPYGTHTVKVAATGAGTPIVKSFTVYQPKKPTLPSTALEVADYNVMATFVANTTAGLETIATGILRKQSIREFIYTGTWSAPNIAASRIGGGECYSNANPKAVLYTFFGTGFEVRGYADTSATITAATVSLNSTTLTSVNFPTASSSNYGGWVFTLATGNLSQQAGVLQAGAGFRVSGLPLGRYTVQISDTSTTFMRIDVIDLITPIHAVKTIPGITSYQANVPVGSCALTDSRKMTSLPLASGNAPGLVDPNAQDIYGPKKFIGVLNPSGGVVGKTAVAVAGHIGEILTFTTRTVAGGFGSWVANASALTTLTQGNWLIFGIVEWDPTNVANGRLCRLSTNSTNDSSGEIVTFGNAAAGNAAASTNGIHHFTGHYEAASSTPIYGKAYGEDNTFTCAVYGFAIRCS